MASGLQLPNLHSPREPKEPLTEGADRDTVFARSAMHDQYGGITKLLFEWIFGPIQYPTKSAETIRELAHRGTIVYISKARTSFLGLYFNYALTRLGLPLAHFVGGISLLLWQPVDRLWKMWRLGRRPPEGAWRVRYPERQPSHSESLLIDIVLRGESAFLFLGPKLRGRIARLLRKRHDYLRALIAAQRTSERPIFVLPHAIAGRYQSGAMRGAIGGRIFGPSRRTSFWGEVSLLLSGRHTAIRVADPIDVQELIAKNPDLDDRTLALRLSHEVHRRINEEERVVAGPELQRFASTLRRVLRSSNVRQAIETVAKETNKTASALTRRAAKLVSEIAARYNVYVIRLMSYVMAWVFSRIYDGIAVDEEGFTRMLEASRRGPLILCPAHRSHVDYLVLSYVLWQKGVAPPHIAAGANLSFFPLGSIFRRGGAFFLRRSFGSDTLYRAVFRSYVAELVRQGTSVEFFLEGGRSRTGKLLLPKFGMLGMVVDAWRAGARDDVQFVPISIDYERIIEAGSYERELSGGEKRPEDFGALLRTTSVLRSRYGRVHVQFGAPLSIAELARQRGLPQSPAPEHDAAWRTEISRLGYRILSRIAQVCTVTPTSVAATALLGHRGRGLAQGALLKLANEIIEYLYTGAARLSKTLQGQEQRDAAVLEAVQKLVDEGTAVVERAGRSDAEPIYRVPEERRLLLDYHKNAVMNYFAPASLVARALVRRGSGPVKDFELREDTAFLSRLFKREFIYRVDADHDTLFDEALATLAVRGLLDVFDDGTVVVRDVAPIRLLASLLDSFIQAYLVTVQSLTDLRAFPLWDRELASRALEHSRRAYLEGTISRPEAANRTLIDSALAWLVEAGVVTAKSEGRRTRLELTEAYEGEKLSELIHKLESYL